MAAHITFEEFNRGDYKDKPTADEFEAYQEVQFSGVTNMFDIRTVEALTGLPKDKIFYIMKYYAELDKQYNG